MSKNKRNEKNSETEMDKMGTKGKTDRFDVRVTEKQGKIIREKAADAGMSASKYMATKSLENPSEPSDWKGKIASYMCRLRYLEQRITDEALRKEYTELGDAMWQFLR